jgi:hypothetical protein
MNAPKAAGTLIAIDGVRDDAARQMALAMLSRLDRRQRGAVSFWDASGVFSELDVAGETAGRPSARTLMLLYAADLAFRLRWEIRPALVDGRSVIAAPYVETAVALGRAAGLPADWLSNLFQFAPKPARRRLTPGTGAARDCGGFVSFAGRHLDADGGPAARGVAERMRLYLPPASGRAGRRSA